MKKIDVPASGESPVAPGEGGKAGKGRHAERAGNESGKGVGRNGKRHGKRKKWLCGFPADGAGGGAACSGGQEIPSAATAEWEGTFSTSKDDRRSLEVR
jgi:hypothetical protein